jgi:putative sugar O-methyltransferase
MTDWDALTQRALAGSKRADRIYRPTNFWDPVVGRLMDDMGTIGLDDFKSWPTARSLFYPTYGNGFTPAMIEDTFEYAARINPAAEKAWLTTALRGSHQARRDFDAARLTWDQTRWPFDIESLGESQVGNPPQRFSLMGSTGPTVTRPYLNYLLCLAALSRHVEAPPKRFLEIGGGFGVLGEIVMSRDPDARYVDFDLPPLTTVTSFYLRALFGNRVAIFDDTVTDIGSIAVSGSACLPNWLIGDVAGPFDVFLNSFSFQEMEPDVVEQYVSQVAAKDVSYVVSLNSILGKRKAAANTEGGVIDPVTSDRITAMFEARGYDVLERYGDPLIQAAGELVILGRSGLATRPVPALTARPRLPTIDRRRGQTYGDRPSRIVRFALDWVPPKLLRGLRRVRRRLL